ncbi:MAG: DUF5777 family beta-barrel protein [Sediminibacterium sp.]
MKSIVKNIQKYAAPGIALVVCLLLFNAYGLAQQSDSTASNTTEAPVKPKIKPAKNTFQSIWIIDNQTVIVPVKGTFEMDIMHRFGTVVKGYKDLWGFFAPSNIRLGGSYSFTNKLHVGVGITKNKMLWDVSAKYAFFTQTKGKYPVSVTYYGNAAIESREDADNSIFKYQTQRVTFFNQLLIARKFNEQLSVQVAPSISHQNSVDGYYTKNDSTGTATFNAMKHDHFAVAVSARYKLTKITSLMINYDQPLTKHNTFNPNPNLSFGVEFNTSGHSFQLFFTNYALLNPQQNNLYNTNNPIGYTNNLTGTKVEGGQFLIGFNITRLWN